MMPTKLPTKLPVRIVVTSLLMLLLVGCATTTVETTAPVPTGISSDPESHLKLVSTDLVSALIQVRRLNPPTTTVQFSDPTTDFGRVLLKAFEDAGYGIQIVNEDRGNNYVSYARRSSETDAGQVVDFVVNINELQLRREYKTTRTGIYPASLMFLSGVKEDIQINLDNNIFAEQGGDELFLSGVKPDNKRSLSPEEVREVVANSNTMIVADRRTQQQNTLARVRRALSEKDKQYEVDSLEGLARYKKVVVIFPDNISLQIGAGNKLAIRELVSDFTPGDVFNIAACDDFDGQNEMAEERATKIRDEIISYGIPMTAVRRAPCIRANFRHQSDDSPIPVSIVQYRKP